MMHDAEAHKEEDQKKRERVEIRNHAEQLAYTTEKQLEEQREQLSAEAGGAVVKALGDLQEALKGENLDAIKSFAEALEQAWYKAAEELYQKTAQEQAAGESGQEDETSQSETTDDSVEADYEVVDDEEENKSALI
jgi:molecular chaperone DnaK